MPENFEPGDTVMLKSGGPTMTVSNVRDDGRVDCDWFDSDNKAQFGVYQAAALRKVDA